MESAGYNSRLQPLSLSLSAGLWQLQYEYTRAGANNNGNVLKQTLTASGMAAITTTYKYDGANRLKTAAELPADGTTAPTCSSPASVLANGWCQEYEYDVWGNRRIAMRVNDGVGVEPSSFNPATNRISDAGWEYSSRGEITRDPANARYAYDGEAKMVLACLGEATCTGAWQAGRAQYTYDGDGQRVRTDARDGSETLFVYDAGGQLAAEYSTTPAAEVGRQYLTADHLGSTRMVTDNSGTVKERHDYQPFGVELLVTSGSPRFGITGYGQDGIRQKFTGKERDAETGLDNFKARYFGSAMGRFSSPDPLMILRQKLTDPQQWNIYAYVRNNPLRFIDPTGMYVCSGTEKECEAFEKARQEALKSKAKDTVRAAKAYGDRGKDNGVNVGFAKELNEDRGGRVTRRDTGIEQNPSSPNGLRATLNVTIKSDLVGNEETIVHEGSHVADHQDFVNAITPDFKMDQSLNIALGQSEIRAYLLLISLL